MNFTYSVDFGLMSGSRSLEFSLARSIKSIVRLTGGERMWLKALLFLLLGGFLSYYVGFSCLLTTCIVFAVYVITGGYDFVWVVIKTLPRDLKGLATLIKLTVGVKYNLKKQNTIAKLFQENVQQFPYKPCFLYEDKTWTYEDVDNYSNSVANFFYASGYKKGDVVSVFMENRPEFVGMWLGLSKIGVVGALINFNLRDKSLAHSINISESKSVIFGGELSQAIKDVLPQLTNGPTLYHSGNLATNDITPVNLDTEIERSPTYPPPPTHVSFKEKLFYIYTSGTTGLPKAAIVTHTSYGLST